MEFCSAPLWHGEGHGSSHVGAIVSCGGPIARWNGQFSFTEIGGKILCGGQGVVRLLVVRHLDAMEVGLGFCWWTLWCEWEGVGLLCSGRRPLVVSSYFIASADSMFHAYCFFPCGGLIVSAHALMHEEDHEGSARHLFESNGR